jgi:hypothetical protein
LSIEHPIEEQIEFSSPGTLKIIFNRPSLYATRKTLLWPHFIRMSDKAYSAGQKVPSTAQIRAEENNTKCDGKKRLNDSVTHGLRKEHVLLYKSLHQ